MHGRRALALASLALFSARWPGCSVPTAAMEQYGAIRIAEHEAQQNRSAALARSAQLIRAARLKRHAEVQCCGE